MQLGKIASSAQQKVTDKIKKTLNFPTSVSTSPVGLTLPWSGEGTKNTFFNPINILPERWNELYPYRLLVVDSQSNSIVSSSKNPGGGANNGGASAIGKFTEFLSIVTSGTKESATPKGLYRITFEAITTQWVFRLPITPQQLSISNPYAIETSATFRGIVEEHGGLRFKMIRCSGTMGVWANRRSIDKPKENAGGVLGAIGKEVGTLFAGTIEAASGVARQARGIINSITQDHPAGKPTPSAPEGDELLSTGYFHAMLLDQFLEQYAESKRDPNNAGWRLVFDIPKQNQSFYVTPMNFVWSQSIESPNEIKYALELKAWKRVELSQKADKSPPPTLDAITPSILQRVSNTLEFARRTVGASTNLLKAIRGDFQLPLNILRQTALLVKDIGGFTKTAMDLPRNIVNDYRSSIKESMRIIGNSFNFESDKDKEAFQKVRSQSLNNEGLTEEAVSSGQLGFSSQTLLSTDPTNEVFQNPEEYFDLFNLIPVESLRLTQSQQNVIDNEIAEIQRLTVNDLIDNRNELQALASQIANQYGASDQFYADFFSLPPVKERVQAMTEEEFEILNALYAAIEAIDLITATNTLDNRNTENAMDYVRQLANSNGITFDSSTSKILAPVPFNLNMEQIAMRYLNDADRWIEIATLNGLRSPYIDENGFMYDLLSNADGRQINIASKENLHVGQKAFLIATGQRPVARTIIDIEKINDTNYLITFDGLDNLDIFTLANSAKLKAYLPGTVNSQNQIFIPSTQPIDSDVDTRPIPALQGVGLVGVSKVDWLLTDQGDIALDNYGDIRLSAGITNLIQALKLKFAVPFRSLIKHPEYGAGIVPGVSVADLETGDLFQQIQESIIADTRFSGINSFNITVNGPTMTVNLSVSVVGQRGVFPISFNI